MTPLPDPSSAAALAVVKPIATEIAKALLKPIVKALRLINENLIDVFLSRFEEYLSRQFIRHCHLPTIVFQVRKPLEDLYVPLTVEHQSSVNARGRHISIKLDKYHANFLPALKKVLVIDDAGMGKSTLSRFLMIQATKTLATVPVFIELRHLNSSRTIVDWLLSELNPIGLQGEELKIDKRQLTRLLSKGIFTFFLDGYDEIAIKDREAVTLDIKRLIAEFDANKFLITSRPENALSAFPSFNVFAIQPLKQEEAFALIRKYDSDGERATRLIERLGEKSMSGVHEFLRNPLLTTLLYRAYDYKNKIPLKKHVFYRQVYDALYEWHDLTKDGYSTREKKSNLDIDSFHKILRGIGFISVLKGKIETDSDGMLGWIRDARTYAPELRFSESDFLEDAIKAVPVFRREGNAVLWAHKSLAEYFAAQFIVNDSKLDQGEICEHIVKSHSLHSYSNFLDLIYDIDSIVFNQYFTRAVVDLYKEEFANLTKLYPQMSRRQLEDRASATFGRVFVSVAIDKKGHLRIIGPIGGVQKNVLTTWHSRGLIGDESDEALRSLRLQFMPTAPNVPRMLFLSHPLIAVFAVLVDKKSSLVLSNAMYPPTRKKTRIVGLRKNSPAQVDNEPNSIWNNPKNFELTTRALMDMQAGVLNWERLNAVLLEIDDQAGKSKTTQSLLNTIGK